MPVVSAFVRIDAADEVAIRQRLSLLEGVTPFDMEEAGQLGVLIEAADLDAAHHILTDEVQQAAGVLAAWPVYVDIEDLSDDE